MQPFTIPEGKLIAWDCETTGIDRDSRPYCFSFCNEKGDTAVVSFPVDPKTRAVDYARKSGQMEGCIYHGTFSYENFNTLDKFFSDKTITKIAHNAQFDVRMARAAGFKVRGPIICTMNLIRLVRSDAPLKLKDFCAKYLGIGIEDETELKEATRTARREGKEKGYTLAKALEADYFLADRRIVERYAAIDAQRAMAIYQALMPEIKEKGLTTLWKQEQKTWKVLRKIEKRGIRVFPDKIKAQSAALKKKLQFFMGRAQNYCPKGTNLNSSKQLREIFYERLKEQPKFLTASGLPSTDVDALKAINHPLAKLILNVRACNKTIEFMDQYLHFMVKNGGGCYYIHPTFHQAMAVTGRESCIAGGTLIEVVRDVSKYPRGIPIEKVKIGDLAYTYNKRGKLCLRKVTGKWYKGSHEVIRIYWKGKGRHHKGYLDVTPSHRVRLLDGTWKSADCLKPLDRVFALRRSGSGHYSSYNNHQIDRVVVLNRSTDVYDLSIEETENFIAGEVCVHNCAAPNMQQVASGRNDKGIEVLVEARSVFGPRPGYIMRSYDWKNIEVFIPAFAANETKITRILSDGGDVHLLTAEHLSSTIGKKIDRDTAKRTFFGLLYGIGRKKLAKTIGVETEVAERIIWGFHDAYPTLTEWMEGLKKMAAIDGFIKTAFGRIRYLSSEETYMAPNAYVQGTAADILKNAKIRISELIKRKEWDVHIVLPIHDELLIEIPEYQDPQLVDRFIVTCMQQNPELKMPVPLPVSISEIGETWADKRKIKTV